MLTPPPLPSSRANVGPAGVAAIALTLFLSLFSLAFALLSLAAEGLAMLVGLGVLLSAQEQSADVDPRLFGVLGGLGVGLMALSAGRLLIAAGTAAMGVRGLMRRSRRGWLFWAAFALVWEALNAIGRIVYLVVLPGEMQWGFPAPFAIGAVLWVGVFGLFVVDRVLAPKAPEQP